MLPLKLREIAAAIGAGVDIESAVGAMVVDIGAGTTDIAIVARGGVQHSSSIKIGGDDFDEAIIRYMRKPVPVVPPPTSRIRIRLLRQVQEQPIIISRTEEPWKSKRQDRNTWKIRRKHCVNMVWNIHMMSGSSHSRRRKCN